MELYGTSTTSNCIGYFGEPPYAFGVWARYTEDTARLKSVNQSSPFHYSAVWNRTLRGDREVIEEVLPLVVQNRRWFHVLQHIWTPQFEPLLDAALGDISRSTEHVPNPRSNDHYALAELLRDIPRSVGERFLEKHWSEVRSSPLFIQAALYIGSPKCIALAVEALQCGAAGEDPFQRVHSFFGFRTTDRSDRLSRRHLA